MIHDLSITSVNGKTKYVRGETVKAGSFLKWGKTLEGHKLKRVSATEPE